MEFTASESRWNDANSGGPPPGGGGGRIREW